MSENIRLGDKTLVAQMGHWSYDWSVFGLFRDDAGRFYIAEDSGCSCSEPWQERYADLIDFTPVQNVQSALRAAHEKTRIRYPEYSEAEYQSFVEQTLGVH